MTEEAQSTRSRRGLRELLNLTVETKVKHILVTIAVAFLTFGLVFYMVEGNGNRDLAREQRANAVVTYQAALRVYDTQVTQVNQCNARYEGRQSARALFTAQNQTIRSILTIVDELHDGTNPVLVQSFHQLDLQDALIEVTYPAGEANTCPPPPTLPVVPETLRGQPEDQTGVPRPQASAPGTMVDITVATSP